MRKSSLLPLGLALVTFWLLTAALAAASVQPEGNPGYPLDDTYIHMAMARHLVQDGFWGVSQTGFSSSSSSPLWTLLVAAVYRMAGVNDWAPLSLGLFFGSMLVVLAYCLLRRQLPGLHLSVFLLLIILFAPVPLLALMGMEHILHALLTLWLLYAAAEVMAAGAVRAPRLVLLLFLASLLTMVRYEGLFLVAALGLGFLVMRQYRLAAAITAAGLLPVAVYGIISTRAGWAFLPNSILLKGNVPILSGAGVLAFLRRLPDNFQLAPHLLVLVIALLLLYLWGRSRLGRREKALVALFVLVTILHMQLAATGWFYRYEAYLVLAGSVILADLAGRALPRQLQPGAGRDQLAVVLLLVLLLLLPLAMRAGAALRDYPRAVTNIHEQQVQMGRFLSRFYTGTDIAANDIGAINYLADIRTLDLYGLASMEVAAARRAGTLDAHTLARLVQGSSARVVVIYTSWFEGSIPAEWIEVGRWRIANNVVCGSDTVSFYAPDPALARELAAALSAFSSDLPDTVTQSGSYLTPPAP